MENTLSDKARQVILPASGRFLADAWAELIGYEPKTLRQKLRDKCMRSIELGDRVFVDAAWFWEDLIACGVVNAKKTKQRRGVDI